MAKLYNRISYMKNVGFNRYTSRILLLLFFTLGLSPLSRLMAEGEKAVQNEIINGDDIRSVQFSRTGLNTTYPYMQLNNGESLTLQFDILGPSRPRNFQYTIVHCDADWTMSNLLQSEYIDGMFQDYIQTYNFSTVTLKKYVHYRVDFPSTTMKPKISGNYIIKIYTDDINKPVLQKRFYVFERAVDVGGTVQRATYSQYRDTKHEVSFTVDYKNLSVVDPFKDIKVVVRQNWRWDNEITDLKPSFVQGTSLTYDYQEGNLFDAGSEFRPFDIRDFQYKSIGVKYFIKDTVYQAVLFPEEDHSYTTYNLTTDQNGGYTVATKATNSDPTTDADYCYVTFRLSPTYKDIEKDIYVFGGLTNWQLDKRFKMTYSNRNGYECTVLLKQGFYDYQFVAVGTDGKIDPSMFEGNHWETENNYAIYVYYRSYSLQGDRLVGIKTLNSALK